VHRRCQFGSGSSPFTTVFATLAAANLAPTDGNVGFVAVQNSD
jgi:hypothetical protein